MPRTFPRWALSTFVLVVLVGLGASAAPVATADPDGDERGKRAPLTRAQERTAAVAALRRAEAILDGTAPEDGRSATLALRDLRMLERGLPDEMQPRAALVGARPVTNKHACASRVCVHWTDVGPDAPNPIDTEKNGRPDYVDKVLATTQSVHSAYVGAGYRAPLPDGTAGGNAKTDIYLQDVGGQGIYGYCTSDDPKSPSEADGYNLWAYCVLDNDYAASQFPTNSPLDNMRVTAAHEYFHAVQFAYDAFEDGWIMEATATWAEDELFDSVDDNLQYLPSGPMKRPGVPMDYFETGGLHQYGTWIFFRYLTEKFRVAQGGLPTLVRDIWRRLDGKAGARDEYSIQGVSNVLRRRSTSLPKELALFAAANRSPRRSYEEGAKYPSAPAKVVGVSGGSRNPGAFGPSLDHLTSATVRYEPRRLGQRDWRLRLRFNLADRARGSYAVVVVHEKAGGVTRIKVPLDASGDAAGWVPFSSRRIAGVEVTLVNAGTRYDCWQPVGTPYSCSGNSLDDDVVQSVDPVAYRP